MVGLAAATSGEISAFGRDVPGQLDEVLSRVGALVEGPALHPFQSGAANLHRARLHRPVRAVEHPRGTSTWPCPAASRTGGS